MNQYLGTSLVQRNYADIVLRKESNVSNGNLKRKLSPYTFTIMSKASIYILIVATKCTKNKIIYSPQIENLVSFIKNIK